MKAVLSISVRLVIIHFLSKECGWYEEICFCDADYHGDGSDFEWV